MANENVKTKSESTNTNSTDLRDIINNVTEPITLKDPKYELKFLKLAKDNNGELKRFGNPLIVCANIDGNGAVIQRDKTEKITPADIDYNGGIHMMTVTKQNGLKLSNFTIDANCGLERGKDYNGKNSDKPEFQKDEKQFNYDGKFEQIGGAMGGIDPLEITKCNNITLDNIKIKNNSYGAIRVHGYGGANDIHDKEQSKFKFTNLTFENTDCGIIFSEPDAQISDVTIENCSFDGHYMSEPISFFGSNAQYKNIKILNCTFKNKNTSAIDFGLDKSVKDNTEMKNNKTDNLTISDCDIINCTGGISLHDVTNSTISKINVYDADKEDPISTKIHPYNDNNRDYKDNPNKLYNGTGIFLEDCSDGKLSNINIASSSYQCLHFNRCKSITGEYINITNLSSSEVLSNAIDAYMKLEESKRTNEIPYDNVIACLENCDNVNISNFTVSLTTPVFNVLEDAKKKYADKKDILDPVQRIIGRNLIKLVKCQNCNIDLTNFIIMNGNPNERIHIWLEDCQNITVSLPNNCGCYIIDDSIYSNPKDIYGKFNGKYSSTTNNNLVKFAVTPSECNVTNKRLCFENQPPYESYTFSIDSEKEIDLSNLPLQNIEKTITIKVKNNIPTKNGSLPQCTIKLKGGNIENASDIVLNPNETYEFKLCCEKADDLIETEAELENKKDRKFKGEKAKWVLSNGIITKPTA